MVGKGGHKFASAGFFPEKTEAPSQPSSSFQKVPEPPPGPSAQQCGLAGF